MTHYLAIVEEEPERAVGLWFPDLPGCFSAGDTLEEAMLNAREALAAYAEVLRDGNRQLPSPRTLVQLKSDPEVAPDLANYMIALIPLQPETLRPAAE